MGTNEKEPILLLSENINKRTIDTGPQKRDKTKENVLYLFMLNISIGNLDWSLSISVFIISVCKAKKQNIIFQK